MRETEFNKWYNSYIAQLPKNNCIFNYDAKLGWNACRDKILEILKIREDFVCDETLKEEIERL